MNKKRKQNIEQNKIKFNDCIFKVKQSKQRNKIKHNKSKLTKSHKGH